VPTARSSSVPTPFSNGNPPPLVRILDFFKFVLDPCSYESIPIIHQDLYHARPVNAEVSDSNHDGQDDSTGNDDGGQGAPSAEPIVPNLIGSARQRKSALLPLISLQSLLLWAAVLRRRNVLCLLNSLRPPIR
jgi:hypothetical protein